MKSEPSARKRMKFMRGPKPKRKRTTRPWRPCSRSTCRNSRVGQRNDLQAQIKSDAEDPPEADRDKRFTRSTVESCSKKRRRSSELNLAAAEFGEGITDGSSRPPTTTSSRKRTSSLRNWPRAKEYCTKADRSRETARGTSHEGSATTSRGTAIRARRG